MSLTRNRVRCMSSLCPGAQSVSHIPRKLRFPQRTEKINMKSDLQLEQDVLEELKWEPSVNAADVGVEVKDGIVTLAGHVSRPGEPQASGTSSTTSPSATDVRRP